MKIIGHALLWLGVAVALQLPFVELPFAELISYAISAGLSVMVGAAVLKRKKFGWLAGFILLFASGVAFISEAAPQAREEGGVWLAAGVVVVGLAVTAVLACFWFCRREYFYRS